MTTICIPFDKVVWVTSASGAEAAEAGADPEMSMDTTKLARKGSFNTMIPCSGLWKTKPATMTRQALRTSYNLDRAKGDPTMHIQKAPDDRHRAPF
jgi:hypothetical protein